MNILIIEDQKMILEIVARLCQNHGDHFIATAESIAAADKALSGFTPDMVISDNRLPDGQGPSLFSAIRAKNPKVFIALMSGDHKEPEGHIADVFLKKPIPRVELHAILSQVQDRPH